MRIPKMAEEAIYMHILYNILAGRANGVIKRKEELLLEMLK